jgi:hypothetical protein
MTAIPIPLDALKAKLIATFSRMISEAAQPGFYGGITLTVQFEDGRYKYHRRLGDQTERLDFGEGAR